MKDGTPVVVVQLRCPLCYNIYIYIIQYAVPGTYYEQWGEYTIHKRRSTSSLEAKCESAAVLYNVYCSLQQ